MRRPIIDSLVNLMSGLGVMGRDKSASAHFDFSKLDRSQLIAAYSGNWISGKIIDLPAFDMVRRWRGWQADKDQITAIEAEEKRLKIRQKVHTAITWSRLFGGAALILHDGAGGVGSNGARAAMMRPLSVTGIGGLKSVLVVDKSRLKLGDTDWDPLSDRFGQPESFDLVTPGGEITLHPSRVVPFLGCPYPDPEMTGNEDCFWGLSVLQRVADEVKRATGSSQAINALLQEAKVDVVRMPGLMAQVGTQEYRDRVMSRWTMAAAAKGNLNMLLLDKDEEYEQKQISFAQLPEVLRANMEIVCGSADIPAVRFLSQSPAGLNSTGESDLRNYYDKISADQEVVLGPTMEPMNEALIMSALGSRPPTIFEEWRPLWQLSEVDQADVELKRSQAAVQYATGRLVPSAALAQGVQNRLIEDGTYPGLEQAIADALSGKLVPFEEPVGPDGLPLGGPRPSGVGQGQQGGPQAAQGGKPGKPKAANENHEITVNGPGGLSIRAKVKARRDSRLVVDATPRSLLIRRMLLNGQQLRRWALDQGFPDPVAQNDLHVTIAFSRKPVDWMKVGTDYWGTDETGRMRLQAGGPRAIERFGDAVVLEFASEPMAYRNAKVLDLGGSAEFPEYRPHITIAYGVPFDFDLSKVEPFRGSLLFGPEIFSEIDQIVPDEGT